MKKKNSVTKKGTFLIPVGANLRPSPCRRTSIEQRRFALELFALWDQAQDLKIEPSILKAWLKSTKSLLVDLGMGLTYEGQVLWDTERG